MKMLFSPQAFGTEQELEGWWEGGHSFVTPGGYVTKWCLKPGQYVLSTLDMTVTSVVRLTIEEHTSALEDLCLAGMGHAEDVELFEYDEQHYVDFLDIRRCHLGKSIRRPAEVLRFIQRQEIFVLPSRFSARPAVLHPA